MNQPSNHLSSSSALRLWPGVILVAIQWLARFGIPLIAPSTLYVGAIVSVVCGLLILVWWAFFSRATPVERFGGAVLLIASLFGATQALHASLANAGMGMMYYMYAVPAVCLALVLWALIARGWSKQTRLVTLAAALLMATFGWGLVRTSGVSGDARSEFSWRWTPSAEEELLARGTGDLAPTVVSPSALVGEAEWPGFRGPDRNSIVAGVRLETDWTQNPPKELWRRPIGPGWSSFAVGGGLLYTQEQRGEEEMVAAYRLSDGEPVWRHANATRFWEAMAGAGPRATPTLDSGQIFALGATGILDALDAASGSALWSRNIVDDLGATIPGWGFASSPLVLGDTVYVAAAGQLAAYNRADGQMLWSKAASGGYSSPHLMRLGGTPQIVMQGGDGIVAVAPTSGEVLWQHEWSGEPIVQPAVTANGDLLFSTAGSSGAAGLRRLQVTSTPSGWSAKELWTTNRLKPYFNDFVVHQGHAYGFDGSIMASVDLEDGSRNWKGGRYGHGQLLLIDAQDLLLVLTEEGELKLVSATPEEFTEVASSPGIEGKTWNHPVFVDGVLLLRNGEEMAALRLAQANT